MSLERTQLAALKTYRDLFLACEPRPVTSKAEAERLTALVEALSDLHELTEDQRDFIALVGELLEDWESRTEEPFDLPPEQVVAALLEDTGRRQIDLVPDVFPTRSAVSDFLAGRRPLNYSRVQKLATFFNVSPALFYAHAARKGYKRSRLSS